MIAGFEFIGLAGGVARRLDYRPISRRTRRARLCRLHGACGCFSSAFLEVQTQSETGHHRAGFAPSGFFVYGPQCLLAIACANLATSAPPPRRSV